MPRKPPPLAAGLCLLLALAAARGQQGDFHVPTTISDEAAAVLAPRKKLPPTPIAGPDDLDLWKALWTAFEGLAMFAAERAMEQYRPEVVSRLVGGVPVLDVKPQGWAPSDRVAVYAHGGGYTLGSANSSLPQAASVANDTGLRVVSVDYSVAPGAKWGEVTRQVVDVISGLVSEGHCLDGVAVYGDSAGGGLAAGSVLRMRDEGRGMPAAVVLWSPWSDVTSAGDTRVTLADQDPVLGTLSLGSAAAAYADPRDQLNAYVSPVYGDYSKGFPPTLIQVGTKEVLLSDSVRHYQALDAAGVDVKLDVYEGMWHVFQGSDWNLPESVLARAKMAEFLDNRLGTGKSP